jgi:hypothetical protein
MRSLTLLLAGASLCALAAVAVADVVLDPPALSVVQVSRSSVVLRVTAGPNGLPGGYSVWWIRDSDFRNAGGWPAAGYYDPRVSGCDFTGEPTVNIWGGSSFVLGPNESMEIELGDIADETGLYANNYNELPEGTAIDAKAYALGSVGYGESGFSPTLNTSTVPRTPTDCTLTWGYWKNHLSAWSRVTSLPLGNVVYTQAQIIQIFATAPAGNGLLSLAHQLIAAKLNVLLGATPPLSVQTAISQADALIGNLVIPPIGSGFLAPGTTSGLTQTLDDFNNGRLGPAHCPDTGGIVPVHASTWGRIKTLYR